jgi:hypothetical protein
MKLIPTQRRRTRIMLDLSYSLFSLIVLYFKPFLSFFWVHFFHPQQVDIPFSSSNWLDGWNKFVL